MGIREQFDTLVLLLSITQINGVFGNVTLTVMHNYTTDMEKTTMYTATTTAKPLEPTLPPTLPPDTCNPISIADILTQYCGAYKGESIILTCACSSFLGEHLKLDKELEALVGQFFCEINKLDMNRMGVDDFMKMSEKLQTFLKTVFDKASSLFCSAVPAFSTCMSTGLPFKTETDETVSQIMDLKKMGEIFKALCVAVESTTLDEVKCLSNSVFGAGLCVKEFSKASGPFSPETLCPVFGDVLRCLGVVVGACHTKFSAVIHEIENTLINPCKAFAVAGAVSEIGSVLVQCALPQVHAFTPLITASEQSVSAEVQIMNFIPTISGIVCEGEMVANKYLKCLDDHMPLSKNRFDFILGELIDYRQLTLELHRGIFIKMICDKDFINNVIKTIPCVIVQAPKIDPNVCFGWISQETFFNDPYTYVKQPFMNIGATIRGKFCGPLHDMLFCALEKVIEPCSQELAVFGRDLYSWIMRTDCYGARNGTIAGLVAKHNSGAGDLRVNESMLLLTAICVLFSFNI